MGCKDASKRPGAVHFALFQALTVTFLPSESAHVWGDFFLMFFYSIKYLSLIASTCSIACEPGAPMVFLFSTHVVIEMAS